MILSTHILSEIQQIAQRVIIIKSGGIVADESLKNLLEEQGEQKKVFVRIRGEKKQIEQAIQETSSLRQINIESIDNVYSLELEIINDVGHYNELAEKVIKAKGQILEINEIKSSLEKVFLRLHSAESN